MRSIIRSLTPPTHTHISCSIKTWPLNDLSFRHRNAWQLSARFDLSDIHSYMDSHTQTHLDSINPRASQTMGWWISHRIWKIDKSLLISNYSITEKSYLPTLRTPFPSKRGVYLSKRIFVKFYTGKLFNWKSNCLQNNYNKYGRAKKGHRCRNIWCSKTRNVRINVTLTRIRMTMAAVEKQ
jgi:hypothetical protein